MPNGHIIEISKWSFSLMDLMGFPFTNFKMISSHWLTTFSIWVLLLFLIFKKMIKTLVFKDYTNENLELRTISIWIIYKNLLVTFVNAIFSPKMNH